MDNNHLSKLTFSTIDYVLFFGMLTLSVAIGIYFGFCSRKHQTKKEYVLGGKNMAVFPISVSLIASQISGITLLAVPADIYKYGSNYIWLCLVIPIVCIINNYVFLPLFFPFQFTSIYEYLNLRFDKTVQVLASFLFILSIFFHNPIVIYIPALAFAQATGVELYSTIVLVCVICTFYTTIGGFKAVVWTDALQYFGMLGAVGAVLFLGAASLDGLQEVFRRAKRGGRLDVFDLTIDPTIRDGFWPIMIGGTTQYMTYICFNQGSMQKYWAVPTLSKARSALFIYCFGLIATIAACVLTGNIVYAKYHNCDPISTHSIGRTDQLLPYFVMEIAQNIPGLPGIFIAGVFSAALSTFSSHLNTAASAIYQDFILPWNLSIPRKRESRILKIIVVISGIISTISALFVDKMSGILSFSIAVNSIVSGPMLGIFLLGTLFSSANAKGTFCGCVTGILFLSWVVIGNQWYLSHGAFEEFSKPVSTAGCDHFSNFTQLVKTQTEKPFILYRISFWYNAVMGCIIVIIVGLVISWFTKDQKTSDNRNAVQGSKYKLLK